MDFYPHQIEKGWRSGEKYTEVVFTEDEWNIRVRFLGAIRNGHITLFEYPFAKAEFAGGIIVRGLIGEPEVEKAAALHEEYMRAFQDTEAMPVNPKYL